jgi:DnaK suppressor protein
MKRAKEKVAAGGLLGYNTRPLRDNVVRKMANSKNKPAARKPATKKSAAARPAKKPAARKPAPKAPARAKSTAKAPLRKAAKPVAKKPAHKPAAKKPARPAPVKSTRKAASHKPAPAQKKGKMSAVIEKDSVTREDGRYALPSTTIIELPANYRPSTREEYMGPKQLAYFRAKLQKWRDDLVEESKQTIDNLRDEVRDVGDEAERATRETENSLELRTRDRYRKLIAKIDKALKRIEEGRYGFCEETDEEIGLERLDARPIATLCLDAQERWEHRQKQMGD